jgi:hypothetical protein
MIMFEVRSIKNGLPSLILSRAANPKDINHKAVTRCSHRGITSDNALLRRRRSIILISATRASEQVQIKDQAVLVTKYVEKAMEKVQKCRVQAVVMGSWIVLRSSR